ncbi:transposase [Streptomyces albus]|uniref:transposase n=1 Tax=Streptomyces albus TaxID=1888 RepID=UPI00099C9DDB|nr:transposase [Streptomyces albus]
MVGIVERLVPDELWELFQRVVPEVPSRPQGGGRRRDGDREVLAAIVFVATSGYTWQQLHAHLRRWLRERGITHRIARKGVEPSQRLGRHRSTVERTMAWLAGCRRLHRRYERKADHFLAFTSIACTLICYRRLAK